MEACQISLTSILELRQESFSQLQNIRQENAAAMQAMRQESMQNLTQLQEQMLAAMTTLITTFAQNQLHQTGPMGTTGNQATSSSTSSSSTSSSTDSSTSSMSDSRKSGSTKTQTTPPASPRNFSSVQGSVAPITLRPVTHRKPPSLLAHPNQKDHVCQQPIRTVPNTRSLARLTESQNKSPRGDYPSVQH